MSRHLGHCVLVTLRWSKCPPPNTGEGQTGHLVGGSAPVLQKTILCLSSVRSHSPKCFKMSLSPAQAPGLGLCLGAPGLTPGMPGPLWQVTELTGCAMGAQKGGRFLLPPGPSAACQVTRKQALPSLSTCLPPTPPGSPPAQPTHSLALSLAQVFQRRVSGSVTPFLPWRDFFFIYFLERFLI